MVYIALPGGNNPFPVGSYRSFVAKKRKWYNLKQKKYRLVDIRTNIVWKLEYMQRICNWGVNENDLLGWQTYKLVPYNKGSLTCK